LHVLVLTRGGRTIAIAPTTIETVRVLGVFPLRLLGMLGRGESDYADLLVLPGHERVACEGIARELLARSRCDVVSIVEVPEGSALKSLLPDLFAAANWTTAIELRDQCPRTALLDTWANTLATFGESHRKRVAYLDRKLRRNFTVELQRVQA